MKAAAALLLLAACFGALAVSGSRNDLKVAGMESDRQNADVAVDYEPSPDDKMSFEAQIQLCVAR